MSTTASYREIPRYGSRPLMRNCAPGRDDVWRASCPISTSSLPCLPVIQQPALALRRMRAQAFFVRLRAPARPVRDDEMAVDEFGHMREQLVIPREAIDIGFHDPQIRNPRADMGLHHFPDMPPKLISTTIHLHIPPRP